MVMTERTKLKNAGHLHGDRSDVMIFAASKLTVAEDETARPHRQSGSKLLCSKSLSV